MSKKKISIISSAYNEEANIPLLYAQVKEQMQKLSAQYDYEQLVLDNASQDGTLRVLREIAAQDPHFKVIANARNFGHIRSPYYGILQCGGDAVIYMASDLQDPPAVLPQLIQKWEEGYKVVLGQKTQSKESPLFFMVRKFYYWLLNLVNDSGTDLPANCTGFGLYDKCVVDELRKLNEPYPYLRGLVCELGYARALVPFVQPVRERGGYLFVRAKNYLSLKLMRSFSITSGLCNTWVKIAPIYSPIIPIKNNCTEENNRTDSKIGAVPMGNLSQKRSFSTK